MFSVGRILSEISLYVESNMPLSSPSIVSMWVL